VIRLAVRCRPELGERVLAELLDLAPGGVEEERGGEWVEYAIYGPPGELPALPALEAVAGEGMVEISSTEIPDDWADRWRDFHRPVAIADGRIVVRPSWAEPVPGATPAGAEARQPATPRQSQPSADPGIPGREAEEMPGIDVVIDPGQAFGTGSHATTVLCLELLLDCADAGEAEGKLIDLGTGSGVLAIAAAKLGWEPVIGCDSEPAALAAAERNADANGVGLGLERINLRDEPAPVAPTMVANLTAPLLDAVLSRLPDPPRTMICSGLLAGERDRAEAALAAAGLELVGERARGEWAALLLRRGKSDRPSN
jgi:ribosomal protein L11 methyltransferase